MSSPHTVAFTLEPQWLKGTFTCSAPEGAVCRSFCDEGCEDQCYAYDEHRTRDQGRCLVVEWLEQDSADESYSGPRTSLHDGPVVAEWEGDFYTWHYEAVTS